MPDEIEVTFVPMAAVDDVDGKIIDPQVRTLGTTRKGYTPFSEGDVLFAKITPCMENGKAAIARNLHNGLGFGSTEFHVMKPGHNVIAEWLFYFVRQSSFRGEAKANFSGTAGQLRVKKGFIEDYQIPLAPLPEQQRIVEEIEKQFTRLDQAVASLKRAQANLQRYKASVLKAACEGRLVPQDPDDETAEILLQRILVERRKQWEEQEWAKLIQKAQKKVAQARRKVQSLPARIRDLEPQEWEDVSEEAYARYLPKNDKWKEKYKEPEGVDTAVLPPIPDGWAWASLEQISEMITDGDHNPPKRVLEGVPHLTARNVVNWNLSLKKCTYVSPEDFEKVRKRYDPKGGDVVLTCVGTLRRTAVVPEEFIFSADRNLAIVRLFKDGMLSEFLQINLNTPLSQKKMLKGSGSTAQPHLYLKDIRTFPVSLAPYSEQGRIIAEVERRLSVIAANEKAIAADLARAERLRQSILQQAFSGRLVPQEDPV